MLRNLGQRVLQPWCFVPAHSNMGFGGGGVVGELGEWNGDVGVNMMALDMLTCGGVDRNGAVEGWGDDLRPTWWIYTWTCLGAEAEEVTLSRECVEGCCVGDGVGRDVMWRM